MKILKNLIISWKIHDLQLKNVRSMLSVLFLNDFSYILATFHCGMRGGQNLNSMKWPILAQKWPFLAQNSRFWPKNAIFDKDRPILRSYDIVSRYCPLIKEYDSGGISPIGCVLCCAGPFYWFWGLICCLGDQYLKFKQGGTLVKFGQNFQKKFFSRKSFGTSPKPIKAL